MQEYQKLRVLIADDSNVLRERLVNELSEPGRVEIIGEARDGLEAIDFINKLKPHLVILDIRMPKHNGIKVLESIAKGSTHPIIIVLTNYPYPAYRTRCLKAGAQYFFDKSTEFNKALDLVKRLSLRPNMS